MSMTVCRDCGASISSRARACPRCGRPVASGRWWLVFLGLVVLAAAPVVYRMADLPGPPGGRSDAPSEPAVKVPTAEELLRWRCTEAFRAEILTPAQAALTAGRANDAFNLVHPCRDLMTDPEGKALLVKAMTAARAEDAERDRADRARRKREGVSIGMTRQQVLESSWGQPMRINRTTTAGHEREQWVYPGLRNYLYFEDGVLTAVQN